MAGREPFLQPRDSVGTQGFYTSQPAYKAFLWPGILLTLWVGKNSAALFF